jgi:hypothetical protein
MTFYDLAAKKALAQEKAPMVIHDLALNETGDAIVGAGHRKVAVFGMKS